MARSVFLFSLSTILTDDQFREFILEHLKRVVLVILCIATVWFSASLNAKQRVSLYSYHLMPPYIIDEDEYLGLYFDFANYLNRVQSNVKYQVVYVPRKRLDHLLANDQMDGIIIGVNPVWFGDKNQTRYTWSKALFFDRDEFVSHQKNKLEYNGPSSLYGKSIGGIKGFKYFGVDQLVKQKKAMRINVDSETLLVDILKKQRVDVAIISRATLDYLVPAGERLNLFHLSHQPHDQFYRYLMTPHQNKAVLQQIEQFMSQRAFQAQWLGQLNRYGFTQGAVID